MYITIVLAAAVFCGCSRSPADADRDLGMRTERPVLAGIGAKDEKNWAVPRTENCAAEPDLGNVVNGDRIELQEEARALLIENGFVVTGDAGSEFFEIYEDNKYRQIPNFITVDSLAHTCDLYFRHLQRNVEKNYLMDRTARLSVRMLENSVAQYERLKGSEWEEAAKRNVAYFSVAVRLLDRDAAVEKYVEDVVESEISRILEAKEVLVCGVTGLCEDYTQYKPQGYYEGDQELEGYFRTMMWYGRICFAQGEEDLDRSAALITKALLDDRESHEMWEAVYVANSFFAGAGGSITVWEYEPALKDVFGEDFTLEELAGNKEAFAEFRSVTTAFSVPEIYFPGTGEGGADGNLGFGFLGQRFTMDEAIMQRLLYGNVGTDGAGQSRTLPDMLDVPAALGSDTALEILREQGAAEYAGYEEAVEKLRKDLKQDAAEIWSSSLYGGWLNALRPLLVPKGEGYPRFMQSEEWRKRSLECFAGSLTELRHDTVFYYVQAPAECGEEAEGLFDDNGYVEPEPLIYFRFSDLVSRTAEGLKQYGMLSEEEERNLTDLAVTADKLRHISNKELTGETLSSEDYDFIRNYGGYLRHFWYEATGVEIDSRQGSSGEYPSVLVKDIVFDFGGGMALEAAVGNPSKIYVVVKVEDQLKIAAGSVYSFYQFSWSAEDRPADFRQWYEMESQIEEGGNQDNGKRPAWTEGYRSAAQ